jgi:tetratricopeptide (TPR) repeat protein
MRLVLFIILLGVGSCHASETSKGWSAWLSEGKALYASGNYSAAAHAFREALSIAVRSDVTDRQLTELHDALAGVYAEAGQFAESEGEYRCALALVEKAEGRRSLNYAFLLVRKFRSVRGRIGCKALNSQSVRGFPRITPDERQ